MANDRWQHEQVEQDALDHELNAALARYSAVEPRAGVEERVLANLRAESKESPSIAWWRWAAAAAIAVCAILVVTALVRRPHVPAIANHPPAVAPETPQRQVAVNAQSAVRPVPGRSKSASARAHVSVAKSALPRLDQFPSPQPLSEQEKIMASYVADYPEQAALLAQARTEALRRDEEERSAIRDSVSPE